MMWLLDDLIYRWRVRRKFRRKLARKRHLAEAPRELEGLLVGQSDMYILVKYRDGFRLVADYKMPEYHNVLLALDFPRESDRMRLSTSSQLRKQAPHLCALAPKDAWEVLLQAWRDTGAHTYFSSGGGQP